MTENELSFSTRRRVILIQTIYALMINANHVQSLDEKEILQIVQNACFVSRYKAKDNLEEFNIDIAILLEIVKKFDIIDDIILRNCKSNSLDRLSKTVLSILRVGIYELKYAQHKYSIGNIIKDYLNIADALEHEPESGFINGILDKVLLSAQLLL